MRTLKPAAMPNRLKILRAVYNLSQYDVARLLADETGGVFADVPRYSRIERGHVAPSDHERKLLAKIFKQSADEIFSPTVAA